jgi:hypothetical protein
MKMKMKIATKTVKNASHVYSDYLNSVLVDIMY